MNNNGSATLHWYALKVYFNKVSDMEEMLGEENVECYVPYLDQVCAKEEDSKKRQVAIPSLMFFHSSPLEARRVQQVVRGKAMVYTHQSLEGWIPAPISEREMNVFRLVVSSGADGLEYFENDPRVFKRGERVRVTGGLFAGAEGHIVRIKGDRRLIVSLTGICAVATSYIPQCFLEKIESE